MFFRKWFTTGHKKNGIWAKHNAIYCDEKMRIRNYSISNFSGCSFPYNWILILYFCAHPILSAITQSRSWKFHIGLRRYFAIFPHDTFSSCHLKKILMGFFSQLDKMKTSLVNVSSGIKLLVALEIELPAVICNYYVKETVLTYY